MNVKEIIRQNRLISMIGRVYMICRLFQGRGKALAGGKDTRIAIIDIHAEATSEKQALAFFLDGRVSAVLGTHTHVQTADERILSYGTGFITDAGMTGSMDSVIGVKKEIIIEKFLTGMPARFEISETDVHFNGVFLSIDETNGKTTLIERIDIKMNAIAASVIPALLLYHLFSFTLRLCAPAYFGDSGELIAMAYTLGNHHRLFISFYQNCFYIPIANPAFRMNLMSAVFAAASLSFYHCVLLL